MRNEVNPEEKDERSGLFLGVDDLDAAPLRLTGGDGTDGDGTDGDGTDGDETDGDGADGDGTDGDGADGEESTDAK